MSHTVYLHSEDHTLHKVLQEIQVRDTCERKSYLASYFYPHNVPMINAFFIFDPQRANTYQHLFLLIFNEHILQTFP